MVNPLDPLTTSPIEPSTIDLSDRRAYLALEDKILEPFRRLQQTDAKPLSATPAKVEGIWNDFDPQLTSRWSVSVDALGAVTLRDNVTPTPGWSLNGSTVVAKCLKIGQLVRVKLVVTQGANKLYGKASVANVAGLPQTIGDYGVTSFVLPYPPHIAGHSGYAIGVHTSTTSTIDALGAITRHPLHYAGEFVIFGSNFAAEPSFFNATGYNGRVALTFMDPPLWNPGPAVYYAGAPGFSYALAGEVSTLFLKYHTDA